jgi:hypothetical protein
MADQQSASIAAANLLAAHAAGYATAFLDGRHSAWLLGQHAEQLQRQLAEAHRDADSNELLDPVTVLSAVMTHTSRACLADSGVPDTRRERWMFLMASLVDMIREISAKHAQGKEVA